MEEEDSYSVEGECVPPPPCSEFQTARLILSHLGFLSVPALKGALDSPVPRLVALENDSEQFVQDLENLDRWANQSNHHPINQSINQSKNIVFYFT